jgi:hypothetical protein
MFHTAQYMHLNILNIAIVRSLVLLSLTIPYIAKMAVFWVVAPCSLVEV